MQTGKSKSSQKTRQPYGKVTEVGQVPIALQEMRELIRPIDHPALYGLIDSIITVTCANPGCISEIAAQSAHVQKTT